MAPSPVVELNRAVAISMTDGPAVAPVLVDGLEGRLGNYSLLPTVSATCWPSWADATEARAEFERAAGLLANERERDLLLAPGPGVCVSVRVRPPA